MLVKTGAPGGLTNLFGKHCGREGVLLVEYTTKGRVFDPCCPFRREKHPSRKAREWPREHQGNQLTPAPG